MQATIRGLDKWMKKVNTDPAIRECTYFYLMGRGTTSMLEICNLLEVGIKGLTLRRHCHTVRVESRIWGIFFQRGGERTNVPKSVVWLNLQNSSEVIPRYASA